MDESRRRSYNHTVNPAKFSARFRNIDWWQPSAIAIIAGNLAPLAALFVFHWDVFSLVFLFWLENIIIGVLNVAKIALASVGAKNLAPFGTMLTQGMKFFLIPFFCMHYGVFTLIQGVFVMELFGHGGLGGGHSGLAMPNIFELVRDNHLEWPLAALVVSHLISFGWDYLWRGEFRRTNPSELMKEPYRRVILMQFTVIGGGMLVTALHQPAAALILLVVLKTITDLWGHQFVRRKFRADDTQSPGGATSAPRPSVENALQAALQARAAQAGQTGRPITPLAIVVVFIILLGGLSFAGYVTYGIVRPFFDHPQSPQHAMTVAKPPAVRVHWTLDLANAQYPDSPAAGLFRANAFRVEHAIFANGMLSLRQGSRTNSRTIVITVPLRTNETLSGHSYKILTDAASPPPEIKMAWHENGSKKEQTQTFTNGYAMKLDFFWPQSKNGKIPAMIYLCLPDSDKSYLAGKFDVLVRKPKSASRSTDN